jgi:rubrerythrin
MGLKGTKTEQNLKDAFAGESQANRRYLYFANKADVEGQNDVAALFRSTAEGETGHAHGHLEFLENGSGDPATGLPIGSSRQNLAAAVAGETHEYTDMYPGMAKTARDEGFDEIADWFETWPRPSARTPTATRRRWTRWSTDRRPSPGRCPRNKGLRPLVRLKHSPRARQPPCAKATSKRPPATRSTGRTPTSTTRPRRGRDGAGVRHLPRLPPLREPVPELPEPVRPGRRHRRRRGARRGQGRLLEGGRPVLPVRPVLHDQVPVHAAAPVEPGLSAPDAARQGHQVHSKGEVRAARSSWPRPTCTAALPASRSWCRRSTVNGTKAARGLMDSSWACTPMPGCPSLAPQRFRWGAR